MKKKVNAYKFLGVLLFPLIWIILKYIIEVEDRFLPSIQDVYSALFDLKPSVFKHSFYTLARLIIGFLLSIILGLVISILLHRYKNLKDVFLPTIQALRSVPPIATVPFFILWFGFAESGRLLMILVGVSLNMAISGYQILNKIPEKYMVMFNSYGIKYNRMIKRFMLPMLLDNILPTVRFSLSTAIGLVIVSELLGSQFGLGYLIQTSRSTYSMHVIFLATIFLGIFNSILDLITILVWKKIIFWK